MADFDPTIIAYGVAGAALLGGGYVLWVQLRSGNAAGPDDKLAAMHEALEQGDFGRAGRAAFDAEEFLLAAQHFARANRPLDAARAWRRAGEWAKAAELFEEHRDFPAAAGCYEKLSDRGAQLRVLEAAGDWSAAARLAETMADPQRTAGLWLKAGDRQRAAQWLDKGGDQRASARLRAETAEAQGQWREAAVWWVRSGELAKAVPSLEKAGDDTGRAQVLAQLGRHAEAGEAYAAAGRELEAGEQFEKAGQYRKAAMHFQRKGEPERAIHCLQLDGDRITVVKLRMAMQQYDEALRVAMSVPPSDPAWVDVAPLAAQMLLQRGEHSQAAGLMLRLLDAPLSPQAKWATGRKTAELFEQLADPERGHQVVAKLAGLAAPGSAEEQWLRELSTRLELMAPRKPVSEPLTSARRRSAATLTPAMQQAAHEHTETLENTEAIVGGRGESNEGWPTGVPRSLAARYADLERLGQGGNGVVFRARDTLLDRVVVLKFMLQGTMPGEMARKYFLREVKLAASLNHPNIVHIYDMGNTDDVLWYAMEYVDGKPLGGFLHQGEPISDDLFLLSVLEQLCGALDYAHGQGLIHRDIKPDNVLVAGNGAVKLLDFGLARVLDDGFGENSILAGTPSYMAPEQLDGSPVDHRADIYALGVVLFRMVTGTLPFTEGNIFVAHASEPVPDPRRWNARLSEAMVTTIHRCMAKKPADRYTTCRQLALDVREALFGHLAQV